MSVCFWCGISKDGLSFVLKDYSPCTTCEQRMSVGVTFVEVDTKPYLNQISMQEGLYPTGVWCVIDPSQVHSILKNVPPESIPENPRMICLEMADYRRFGLNPKFDKLH